MLDRVLPMAADPRYVFVRQPRRDDAAIKPAGTGVTLDRDRLLDNNIFGFEYTDARAQPFVLLRSQLMRRLDSGGARIIAVTSTQPHNGKSFVAANLAAALSQIRPVCLVDLDLRRPTVGERFGLPKTPGVDDYLLGGRRFAEAGSTIDGHRMTIMPVRQVRANAADLLASSTGDALFAELRQLPESTVTVIDTPPLLEGDEMMIIAGHVDGVVLVAEEGRTRSRDMREALRMLQSTTLLGTVLNKSLNPTVKSSYYRYGSYRRMAEPRR